MEREALRPQKRRNNVRRPTSFAKEASLMSGIHTVNIGWKQPRTKARSRSRSSCCSSTPTDSASSLRRQQMRFKFSVILLVALFCGAIISQAQPAPAKEGNASEWKDFSSAEGQFTVCVPGTPTADVATVGTIAGPLKTHFVVVKTDNFQYYISYAGLSESPQTPAEIKMALDQTRDRTAAKGHMLSENSITFDGIVGREVLLERNGLIQKGRSSTLKNVSIW